LLAYFVAAPINHVLRGETWALRRLQPYAGCTARFDLPPFSFSLTIRESGEVAPAMPAAAADVTFRLTPPAALRLLAGDHDAEREVTVSGNPDLAQAVQAVVRDARWDVEEDLARVFGDIAAHRITSAGRTLARVPQRAASSLARNLADYWLQERPLIARREDVEGFVREVDRLRDDVERLAQRIARL